MKAVTVQQMGTELAEKTARANQIDQQAQGSSAHIQADDVEGRGPLLVQARPEHHERNRMAAILHASSQRQYLPLRSAHAERCEHIDDPHFSLLLPGIQVKRS
jgi:hypothetical protein